MSFTNYYNNADHFDVPVPDIATLAAHYAHDPAVNADDTLDRALILN